MSNSSGNSRRVWSARRARSVLVGVIAAVAALCGAGAASGAPATSPELVPFVGSFRVSATWGAPSGGYHAASTPAIDVAMPVGTSVYAAGNGQVKTAQVDNRHCNPDVHGMSYCLANFPNSGSRIYIAHPDGRISRYLHLSRVDVSVGQQVTAGQRIGLSGNTGISTGPHLHYDETNSAGTQIAPGDWLACFGASQVWHVNLQNRKGETFRNDGYGCHAPPGGGGSPLVDGSFVGIHGRAEIFRMAGGAPIYVDTWSHYGGSQPTTYLTQAQFDQLRQYPADGTAIDAGGHVYIVAGGAPIYVSAWPRVGGARPTVKVSPAAIANAGAGGVWNHLRQKPANGTIIVGGGHVYVVAGGAPIYVHAWSAIGGERPGTTVDSAAIDRAGDIGVWSHLNRHPADGTAVVAHGNATVYIFAGGAPMALTNWNNIPTSSPVTTISQGALDSAGAAGRWAHIRSFPLDGTFIQATGGNVYRFAGGAPIHVGLWARIGGPKPVTAVDAAVINRAGEGGMWRFVRTHPVDGTILRAGPSGSYYRTVNGVPLPYTDIPQGAITVDPFAVANAGGAGPWRFLRAAPTPPAAPPARPSSPTTPDRPSAAGATGPVLVRAARLRSAKVVYRGARIRIGLAASPGRALAGRRVLIQRQVGGKYRALTATTVARNGNVRAVITLNRRTKGLRGTGGAKRVVMRLAFPKQGSAPGLVGPSGYVPIR